MQVLEIKPRFSRRAASTEPSLLRLSGIAETVRDSQSPSFPVTCSIPNFPTLSPSVTQCSSELP